MFDHLKLYRDIAHTRSVSRGARLNGISQSAASQHLQEMERLYGVQLLDRSTRPVAPTEAGRIYFEFCRDVLRRKEEFDVALDGLKGRAEGTVRVAAIYSVGISDMSGLEQEMARRMFYEAHTVRSILDLVPEHQPEKLQRSAQPTPTHL